MHKVEYNHSGSVLHSLLRQGLYDEDTGFRSKLTIQDVLFIYQEVYLSGK